MLQWVKRVQGGWKTFMLWVVAVSYPYLTAYPILQLNHNRRPCDLMDKWWLVVLGDWMR